jgi:predicted 2-oxoglutarate/Fe(II)-dependent dioxygenase YbiX
VRLDIFHIQFPGIHEYINRVNERLSFLRYRPGGFFKPHCDGQLQLPDGRQSKVTLQIYLKNENLSGGATSFLGGNKRFVDIEPKVGRVLIFQQKGLYHSGQEVTKGVKYALRSDFMFEEAVAVKW